MEQYDRNIKVVMDFLKAKNYSASVISLHRLCYREFKEYLHQNELSYSFEESNKWLENNKDTWDYRRYTGWKHCLDQLNDVFQNRFFSLDHLGPHASAYALLSSTLRNEIDEFLTYGLMYSKDSRYRISCSRFMLYLEEKGLTSIKQLNYDILLTFHEEDYHRSAKSKDVYEDLIRALLRYHASKGRCVYGHALALNKMLIHQIITIDQTEIVATSKVNLKTYGGKKYGWATAKEFVKKWDEHLKNVPQKVKSIQSSPGSKKEKNDALIQLGLPAVPFIMDSIEQGNEEPANTDALEVLLKDNAKVSFSINDVQNAKGWIQKNKSQFTQLRAYVEGKK